MKKIYLTLCGLAVIGGSFAQRNYELNDGPASYFSLKDNGTSKASPLAHEKSAGVLVWTDGFDTPSNWTIDNSGQSAAGFGWNINSTEESWWTTHVINSVSAGNFAELENGDPTQSPGTQALNVTYTVTTAAPVTIPSGQVTLSFLQYGARFNDAQEMYVSTDGTAWTKVGDNSDHPVLSASAPGNAYANPTTKSINLASTLGSATSVWIRFSWTTAYPASASNANVWVTYGWMIDDVTLTTNPDYDLAENSVIWGSTAGAWATMPYYQIPTTQIAPVDFGGIIQNNGINDQTDIVFHANATGYTGASLPSTVNSSLFDTIWVDNALTPAATVGATTVSFNVGSGATDDVPANNATAPAVTFNVTNYVYARDNGVKDATESNTGLAYEVGNVFEIMADQTLYSIITELDNTTTVSSIVRGILYSIDPGTGAFTEIDRSDDHVVVAGDLTAPLRLELQNTTALTAATPYCIVIGTDGGTSPDVVVKTGGTSDTQTSFFKDETGTWFYTTHTPMVRMDFANQAGLKENTNDFGLNLYPNPAANQTKVTFNLNNESNVSVVVTDLTGKTVYTNNLGTLTNGSHNNVAINTEAFTSGVYYVTVSSNGSQTTKKLIKK